MSAIGFNSWTTGEGADIVTDMRAAGLAGYDAIEICDWKIERYLGNGGQISDLRGYAADAGLRVLTVNTLDDSTLNSGERQNALLARCQQLCSWAMNLDCPYIIAGPSYVNGRGLGATEIRQQSAAALKQYAKIANDHGVKIGFEFLGYTSCSIHTLPEALNAVDEADSPDIGFVIDAFHFYVGGTSLEVLSKFDLSRLFVVHLTDADHADRATLRKNNRTFPGEGALPIQEFVEALRRAGYDGPYSIELLRPEYWTMDPYEITRRGMTSMRAFVA